MEYLIYKVYVHYFSADKISLQPLSLFRKWINKSKERSILVQIMLLKVQMQLHRSVMCHFLSVSEEQISCMYLCVCVCDCSKPRPSMRLRQRRESWRGCWRRGRRKWKTFLVRYQSHTHRKSPKTQNWKHCILILHVMFL